MYFGMEGKDIMDLKQRELKRLHVIHKVLDEALKQDEAAELLSLSDRQIRRILVKVRDEGDAVKGDKDFPGGKQIPNELFAIPRAARGTRNLQLNQRRKEIFTETFQRALRA